MTQDHPTETEVEAWRVEISTWPPTIRPIAERFTPWAVVRIKSTGALGRAHGFSEALDGAVTVDVMVRQHWNPHLHIDRDQLVSGLSPTALEMVQ